MNRIRFGLADFASWAPNNKAVTELTVRLTIWQLLIEREWDYIFFKKKTKQCDCTHFPGSNRN